MASAEREQIILRLIARHEAPTIPELAEYAGLTPSTTRTTVRALVRQGFVQEGGTSATNATAYLITDEGRDALIP